MKQPDKLPIRQSLLNRPHLPHGSVRHSVRKTCSKSEDRESGEDGVTAVVKYPSGSSESIYFGINRVLSSRSAIPRLGFTIAITTPSAKQIRE